MDGLKAEEKSQRKEIDEVEDRIETVWFLDRKWIIKKINMSQETCGTQTQKSNIHVIKVLGEEREDGAEKWRNIAWKCSKLGKRQSSDSGSFENPDQVILFCLIYFVLPVNYIVYMLLYPYFTVISVKI